MSTSQINNNTHKPSLDEAYHDPYAYYVEDLELISIQSCYLQDSEVHEQVRLSTLLEEDSDEEAQTYRCPKDLALDFTQGLIDGYLEEFQESWNQYWLEESDNPPEFALPYQAPPQPDYVLQGSATKRVWHAIDKHLTRGTLVQGRPAVILNTIPPPNILSLNTSHQVTNNPRCLVAKQLSKRPSL